MQYPLIFCHKQHQFINNIVNNNTELVTLNPNKTYTTDIGVPAFPIHKQEFSVLHQTAYLLFLHKICQ